MHEAWVLLSLLGSKHKLSNADEEVVNFTVPPAVTGHGTATLPTSIASPGPAVSSSLNNNDDHDQREPPVNLHLHSILHNHRRPNPREIPQDARDPQVHPHKNLVKLSMILKGDDPATECHKVLAHLFTKILEVDREAAILPVDPLSILLPLQKHSQMPSNWTNFGQCIFLKGGAYSFDPKNDQNGNCKHPKPWLVLNLASVVETMYLLQLVSAEYEGVNDCTIRVKSCQSFLSYTPIMFPFLFKKAHLPSLQAQLKDLLKEAYDLMVQQRMIDVKSTNSPLSEFNLRANNPCLPYQASIKDKKFDSFTSQNKQIIHLECCKTVAPQVQELFCNIKETGLMWKTFGKCVHVTKPWTHDACSQDCALLRWMFQLHTNFHNSMRLHSICGIVNLTVQAKIGKVDVQQSPSNIPHQSFHDILYGLCLPDKSPLFLSILPRTNGLTVDFVIPNTAMAKTWLIQMNHHLPGYLKFHLKDLGYNGDGINNLLDWACDPDLTATISQWSWDPVHKVVILPSKAELEYNLDKIEIEPWMQTIPPTSPPHPSKTKHYNDPDHAFPLSSNLSVMTIHANQKTAISFSPPTTPPAVSTITPMSKVVVDASPMHNNVSTFSTMSKGDLVKMLLQLNFSHPSLSSSTGFAPDRESSPHTGTSSTMHSHPDTREAGTIGCPVAAAMGK